MMKVGICHNKRLKTWKYLCIWAVERGRKNFEMHNRKRLDCFEQIAKINMDVNISAIKNSDGSEEHGRKT